MRYIINYKYTKLLHIQLHHLSKAALEKFYIQYGKKEFFFSSFELKYQASAFLRISGAQLTK